MDYEEGLILETGTHTPLRSKGKKIRKTKSKFSLYLRIFLKKNLQLHLKFKYQKSLSNL